MNPACWTYAAEYSASSVTTGPSFSDTISVTGGGTFVADGSNTTGTGSGPGGAIASGVAGWLYGAEAYPGTVPPSAPPGPSGSIGITAGGSIAAVGVKGAISRHDYPGYQNGYFEALRGGGYFNASGTASLSAQVSMQISGGGTFAATGSIKRVNASISISGGGAVVLVTFESSSGTISITGGGSFRTTTAQLAQSTIPLPAGKIVRGHRGKVLIGT